jgi:ABC-2 type transport system ATP-binding protein
MTDVDAPDIVRFEEVTHRYGEVVALRDVTLGVGRGEMFGLIGPDGAGKTTTIRLMCGLLHPAKGRIRVLGRDPAAEHRAITQSVGYLSQRFSLYGDLSIDENIAFFAEIHGMRDYGARRDRLLEMTQLTPFRDRLADRLSGGMKQKLALACTLVHEPDLIVLDEPTTGVDPVSRREFWKLLSEFLSHGLTIVMSTPYLDEAERCSRVTLLHEGRILASDTPSALRATLPGSLIEVIAGGRGDLAGLLSGVAGVVEVQMFGERAHVRIDAPESEVIDAIRRTLNDAGRPPMVVRPIAPSLEDVFITRLDTRAPLTLTLSPVPGEREHDGRSASRSSGERDHDGRSKADEAGGAEPRVR